MNKNNNYVEAQERMNYIREFANKMGYEAREEEYHSYESDRPCFSIELLGTYDSDGNAFMWAWYTDTWEEC